MRRFRWFGEASHNILSITPNSLRKMLSESFKEIPLPKLRIKELEYSCFFYLRSSALSDRVGSLPRIWQEKEASNCLPESISIILPSNASLRSRNASQRKWRSFCRSVLSLLESKGVKRVRLWANLKELPEVIVKDEKWREYFDNTDVSYPFHIFEKYDGKSSKKEWEKWTFPFTGRGYDLPKNALEASEEKDVDEDVEMVEKQ